MRSLPTRDGADQRLDALDLRGRHDPVAEVEDMRRSGRMQILVGRSETVEHLHFVDAVEEDAAVAAALAVTFHNGGRGEFEVELEVGEFVLGLDASGAADDFHVTVFNFPAGFASLAAFPIREVGAVEKHDRVRRRLGHVAEGVYTAKEVVNRAKALHVSMPITHEVNQVLSFGKSPKEAVIDLLGREQKSEIH